jgi:peptide/nickel transport system ATP-binding protein
MSRHNVIYKLENVQKWFPVHRTMKDIVYGQKNWIKAVDGVFLEIKEGEIFTLVGESGCGKTTTARLVMKLLEPTGGKLFFKGEDVTHLNKENLQAFRRNVQMIFQDPYASMNPRFRTRDILEEPLIIHHVGGDRDERQKIIAKVMDEVLLQPPEEFMARFPHMLSGGQRQKVATARTLVLSPSMVVADEPVSMIDLSTRAEILHMMKRVQKELNLTYLYITHDLSTARYFADHIAVMYLGKVVEMGEADKVIMESKHPYTKALIASVCEPIAGKVELIKEIPIKGEVPSAANIPSGCRFHPRCLHAMSQCEEIQPDMTEVSVEHQAACHLLTQESNGEQKRVSERGLQIH